MTAVINAPQAHKCRHYKDLKRKFLSNKSILYNKLCQHHIFSRPATSLQRLCLFDTTGEPIAIWDICYTLPSPKDCIWSWVKRNPGYNHLSFVKSLTKISIFYRFVKSLTKISIFYPAEFIHKLKEAVPSFTPGLYLIEIIKLLNLLLIRGAILIFGTFIAKYTKEVL